MSTHGQNNLLPLFLRTVPSFSEQVIEENSSGRLLIGLRLVSEHEFHLAVVHQPRIQVPVQDHRQIEARLHRVRQRDAPVLAGQRDTVDERLVMGDTVTQSMHGLDDIQRKASRPLGVRVRCVPTPAGEGFDDAFAPKVVLVVGAALVRPVRVDSSAVLQQVAPEPERQRRDEMAVRVPFPLLDGEMAPCLADLALGAVVETETRHIPVLGAGLFQGDE